MSAIGNAIVVFVASLAVTQDRPPTLDDFPPLVRLTENFYGALDLSGKGVTAEWSAPKSVPRDTEFTLTLIVRGAANPHELIRPDLRKFEAFTRRFQLLDNPDHTELAAAPSAKEVRFNYRVLPRAADKVDVPPLDYVYYRPKAPAKEQFQPGRARSITISLTAPATKVAAPPIEAPEEFFTLAADEPPAWSPGLFAWALPVAAVPFVVGGWLLVWRIVFPDAARLAKLRRHRATRTALDRLKQAHSSADPAGAAAFAFRQYLTARFGVPPSAQTPTEVAAALRDREHPAERAADAEAFLRACDATRFDQSSDNGLSLVKQAELLIVAWEGVGE